MPLQFLINRCILEGVFPQCLKISKVTPIHKNGSSQDPNNYRPIALVPIFSKIIETIISEQLMTYLEDNKCFTDIQHGFRKGRSTTHAIDTLTSMVLKNFVNKTTFVGTFCDLTKAFDCLKKLIEKLVV